MRTAGFPEEIRLRQCHGQTDNGVTDSVQEVFSLAGVAGADPPAEKETL